MGISGWRYPLSPNVRAARDVLNGEDIVPGERQTENEVKNQRLRHFRLK
jgi:hypothetical protein